MAVDDLQVDLTPPVPLVLIGAGPRAADLMITVGLQGDAPVVRAPVGADVGQPVADVGAALDDPGAREAVALARGEAGEAGRPRPRARHGHRAGRESRPRPHGEPAEARG